VDRRIRRTQQAIKSALLKLLTHTSLEQLSIRDIAAAADVSYTTLYRHYPEKEALLAEIANNEITQLLDYCAPIFKASNSYAACLALCHYVDQNRVLWQALLVGGAADLIRKTFATHASKRSSEFASSLEWLPVDIGNSLIIGFHIELLTWWLRDAKDQTPEQVALILDKLLMSGLKSAL
jgi:AcrR family transcriptional regulator